MKIAIVTDAIYPFTMGGSEARNHEIAKRLAKMGHQVHILGAKLWDGENQIEIDGVKIFGLSEYKRLYTKKGRRSVLPPLFLSLAIFYHLLKNEYDIVDVAAFNFLGCFSCKLSSLIKKNSLVITWHQYFGDYLKNYFGKVLGTIAMIMEKFVAKFSKNHIAVSNFVKSELIKHGVPEKNIKVIPNGADINLINKIENQPKIYDLIFVGRLNYQKNLALLVESIKILKTNLPEVKVAIVGRGEEKENLENLIKKYGLENNFEFLGEIKDREKLFEIFKSAKIFVLPSILEGFPLTIVEANACGLPIVSVKTKHNNTEEYINDVGMGFLCDSEPKILSEIILKTLKNVKTCQNDGDINKKIKKYNWDSLVRLQESYYSDLQNSLSSSKTIKK